jgi:hypothetical protein
MSVGETMAAAGAFVTGLGSLVLALQALIAAAAKATVEIHEELHHDDHPGAERDPEHG